MSGANSLLAPNDDDDDGEMNMLAGTARAPSISPSTPSPGGMPPLSRRRVVQAQHVAQTLAGHTQDQVIQKRDNAGKEMAYLAQVMNNPKVTRADVSAYLGGLANEGQITPDELVGILRTLPHQSEQIRQWAQMMFAVMAHVGVHGHAAYPASLFPGGQQAPGQQQQPQSAGAQDVGEDGEADQDDAANE